MPKYFARTLTVASAVFPAPLHPQLSVCSEPPPGNTAFSVQSALGSSLRMSGKSGFTEFCFLSWKWAEWPQKVLGKCGGFPSIICKYKNVFTETKALAGVRMC